MIGLAYLIAAGVYVWLTAKACGWAWRQGITSGSRKRGWLYGLGMLVVMYHLVFWDLIPTKIMHTYYCRLNGGTLTHVSADKWLADNKNELPSLDMTWKERKQEDIKVPGFENWYALRLNRAVALIMKDEVVSPSFLNVRRYLQKIVDLRTKSILLEETNYSAGQRILEDTLRPQPYIDSCTNIQRTPPSEIPKYENLIAQPKGASK